MLKGVGTILKLRILTLFLKNLMLLHPFFITKQFLFWHYYIQLLPIRTHYFLQIDGVPGLAVTLFSLLLELHKDEEMTRNSVDEAVC